MKAVAMMKKAINDSNLNGYKWTADKNGLHWNYGVDFEFTVDTESNGVFFEDKNSGCDAVVFLVTEEDAYLVDGCHDFATDINEAIYWAARKMIKKANYCY